MKNVTNSPHIYSYIISFIPGFHTLAGDHGEEGHHDLGVCLGPNLTCMNDMMNRMGQFDHVEYKGQQGLSQVKCWGLCIKYLGLCLSS